MPDSVTQWLEQLGMGQYAEAFAENAVGLEHLPSLDHETLKEIGVRAVGHRMTILTAALNLVALPISETHSYPKVSPFTLMEPPMFALMEPPKSTISGFQTG